MNDQEKRIKEQRTLQANKKGLLGLGGKLGMIVRFLGEPIVGNDSDMYESNTLDLDPYANDIDADNPENLQKSIPYMDIREEPTGMGWREDREINNIINVGETVIGWHFDGLRRSMHLEVRYLESEKEIRVQYQGYTVYQEVAGDLCAYNPNPEWEEKIDKLYESARMIEKKRNKAKKIDNLNEAEKNKQSWFEKIKTKWGLQ